MVFVEKYTFSRNKYNKDGFNIENGVLFTDLLDQWADDFTKKHPTIPPTHLFANGLTMLLIENCLCLDENDACGMDLIDGKIDEETNWMIEKHSKYSIIYGLEMGRNTDMVSLIIDESVPDDILFLKHIPDTDSDDTEIPVVNNVVALKAQVQSDINRR